MKKLSFYALVIFFIVAGVNHFVMPAFYLPLIPDYLPFHGFINILSGLLELALGLLLFWPNGRKWAAYGLIALMIAFIPAHVHFILLGSCVENGLCVPEWVGWGRLLVIHPLLIFWIWKHQS